MTHLLALDAGTTSVKVALFDTFGRVAACQVNEYGLRKPSPDYVEADPEDYWKAAVAGIAGVLRESGVAPGDIAAAGVTSQGETLVVLGADGKPLRPAMVWLDNRAQDEARRIEARFGRQLVHRTTGQHEVVPGWTACKILWLREHEPEVFAKTDKFLMVADYLVHRLTGRFASDRALNPSTLYYDLSGVWWKDMLDFLGVKGTQLPRLGKSGDVVGGVTADVGLSPGTVVTLAPIDQIAGAVGAGNLAPGMVTETTGSAMALCATVEKPFFDPQMRVSLYHHALPGAFVLMPWTPTAGMVLRWFRDEFCGGQDYAALAALAAAVPPGCDGLTLLPRLGVSRGVFHGVGLAHGRGHFVRAIMESVAFLLRDNLETLALDCADIRSLGGASRSALWLQIKADVLNRPVSTLECEETTCLGTALLAAVGAGVHPNHAEAAAKMLRRSRTFAPGPDASRYQEFYGRYSRLNQLLGA